jgi:hypothetical protein
MASDPALPRGGKAPSLAYARLLAIAASIVAGLAAFGLGEAFYERIAPRAVKQTMRNLEVVLPSEETELAAAAQNGGLTFGLMGASLGLIFGLAGGIAGRRTKGEAAAAGVAGLVLGAVVGAAIPLALLTPYAQFMRDHDYDDLLAPMGMHTAIWGPIGAAAGLAFGIGLGTGHRLRSSFYGLIGAAVGTAVYEVLGAAIDPMALTSAPISKTWTTRLLARVLVALCVGLTLALSIAPPRSEDVGGQRPADPS